MNGRMKLLALMALFGGFAATGCASTNVTSETRNAPITYRIGQGDAQYVSLNRTPRTSRPALPRAYDPLGGQTDTFDPSKIDRNLYKHQKVGKTYTIMGQTFTPRHNPDYNRTGVASWYGPKFHGKPTANGETFDKRAMTAAHPTLPLNSLVRVTNLDNGKSVVVRLNDRGPFVGGRMIDMSEAGAEALGYKQQGTVNVRVRYLGPANPGAGKRWIPKEVPRMVELPRENLTPAPRPAPYIPPVAAPRPVAPQQAVPQVEAPRYTPAPVRPSAPRRTPQADLPKGDITMTIKGPIHIARSDDSQPSPEFIAEPARSN